VLGFLICEVDNQTADSTSVSSTSVSCEAYGVVPVLVCCCIMPEEDLVHRVNQAEQCPRTLKNPARAEEQNTGALRPITMFGAPRARRTVVNLEEFVFYLRFLI
jgi:hypothetical protein